jgi:hypothetical protein
MENQWANGYACLARGYIRATSLFFQAGKGWEVRLETAGYVFFFILPKILDWEGELSGDATILLRLEVGFQSIFVILIKNYDKHLMRFLNHKK